MKIYVIPTATPRISERHEFLGPYSDTENGLGIANGLVGKWAEAGVACKVIRSATAPVATAAQTAIPERGLVCDILVPRTGLCANGGISDFVRRVTLMVPELAALTAEADMAVPLREATADAPAVTLARIMTDRIVAQPVVRPTNGKCIGPMASGAWIVSDDWRWSKLFGHRQPIALHDRFETTEQYAALSD